MPHVMVNDIEMYYEAHGNGKPYSVLCHVLTREAAENIGRPDKAVSPTFFNT